MSIEYSANTLMSRFLFVFLVAAVVVANARPPHFGENNQIVSEQEPNANTLESGPIGGGLKPWQIEMLYQRLAELNNAPPMGFEYPPFERQLRSQSNSKRQNARLLCYFNPVSCFKK